MVRISAERFFGRGALFGRGQLCCVVNPPCVTLRQLVSVVKGDMSVVAPRPTNFQAETSSRWQTERPSEVHELRLVLASVLLVFRRTGVA
jgi:hypothetical protein